MTSLKRLLLEASAEPERITELLTAISMELSQTRDTASPEVDTLLEDFYLALNLAEKICQASADKSRLESIVQNMPMAMLIVSGDLSLQGCNDRAQAFLERGSHLILDGNRIRAQNLNTHQQLEDIVTRYATPRAQSLPPTALNLPASNNATEEVVQCYVYQQSRFDLDQQHHTSDICLLLNDVQGTFQTDCIKQYAQHHNLTPAETETLELLSNGKTLNEIAELRNVSINTARTQLKVILKKTGAKRQSNLIQQALGYASTATNLTDSLPKVSESLIYTLEDGRQVSYFDSGGNSESIIVHCHGMFTSRLDPLDPNAFHNTNTRLIIPDRPGYGLSDPLPNHTITDWVDDLLQLMDGLAVDRFTLLAADFSSAYALAVASLAPDRVNNIILLEGATPVNRDVAKYETAIPVYYKTIFFAAQKIPKVVHKATYVAYALFSKDPEKALERFVGIIGEDNAQTIRKPSIFPKMVTAIVEAQRQGIHSIICNQMLMFTDWGITFESVRCPVLMIVGEGDSLACYHKERLQKTLPNPITVSMPGKGWASMLYEEMETVLQNWYELD